MEDLKHYGIPGMKWGVRNGPPYPLGESQKTTAEKKKNYQDKNYASKTTTDPKKLVNNAVDKIGNKHVEKGIWDDLSDETKAELVLLGLAAAYAVGDEISYRVDIHKNIKNNVDFNEIKHIDGDHTIEEDMAAVNPHFKEGPQFQSNCTMCTAAYELRRRGYDVEANITKKGRKVGDYRKWFNISKKDVISCNNYNDMKKALNNMPDGSRGNFSGPVGMFHSSHSMAWEKIDGNVVIRDCQENRVYTSIDSSIICKDGTYFYVYRTDNATINETRIMDAVIPRGSKRK